MSKRCNLQKEYYKEFGNYKGNGKYSDEYVKWLEDKVLSFRSSSIAQASKEYYKPLEIKCKGEYVKNNPITYNNSNVH